MWEQRIQKRQLNLIFGDGEVGKSFVALDLAARITKGLPMPNSTEPTPIGEVIYFCREMDPPTLKGRGTVAGVEWTKFFCCQGKIKNSKTGKTSIMTVGEGHQLAKLLNARRPALLIIDPIISIFGDVDSNSYTEVYNALDPLIQIAHEAGVTLLGIVHTNKGQALKARDKMMVKQEGPPAMSDEPMAPGVSENEA